MGTSKPKRQKSKRYLVIHGEESVLETDDFDEAKDKVIELLDNVDYGGYRVDLVDMVYSVEHVKKELGID